MRRWLNALVLSAAAALAGSAPSLADPNCRCRLYGQYFDIGSVMCIRGKLRRCEMNQNNTSWKQIGDICPQALLDDSLPDQPRRAYAARLGSSIPSPE